MSKHTPGPWFVNDRYKQTKYIEARIGGGMLQEVAACGPTEVREQQEANARLIAAAPDLLDALEDALCFLAMNGGYDYATNKARVAIAKATGEEK